MTTISTQPKPISYRIARGMEIGMDNRMILAAKKFMEINGYKTTIIGKRVACSEIAERVEDPEASIALQTAIMLV